MIAAGSDLQPGDHAAFFYRHRSEQFAYAIPFIQQGLDQNERCFYIADNNSVPRFLLELEKVGIDIDVARRSGALTVATKRETYLKHGDFDPYKMIATLKEEAARSRELGFTGFRASGEMTWALESPSSLTMLTEYEARLEAERPPETTFLCQYDETRFPERLISEMIRVHPKVIARGGLRPNPFYDPADPGTGGFQEQLSIELLLSPHR